MRFLDWLNPKEPSFAEVRTQYGGDMIIEPAHVIAERQLRDTALARAIDYAKTSLDHMDATAIVNMASRFHAFLSGGSEPQPSVFEDIARQYKGQP